MRPGHSASLLALAGLFCLIPSNSSVADPIESLQTVEIPVQAALAPPKGFDDNDRVHVVLYGSLPNACYVLLTPDAQSTESGKFHLKQYALLRKNGICADPSKLPEAMKYSTPFQSEVSLGHLNARDYELSFDREDGTQGKRMLNVSRAPTLTVDSMPYAATTQVSTPDATHTTEQVEITLSGVLNSSCSELDPNVEIRHFDDTTIVLPIVRMRPLAICAQVRIPFFRTIILGQLKEGAHLVHVRSANGVALNRVIDVQR